MKTALKYLLDFLERKFPDKVVVTAERYRALESKVDALNGIEERLAKMQGEINKFNVMMGFAQRSNGMVLER